MGMFCAEHDVSILIFLSENSLFCGFINILDQLSLGRRHRGARTIGRRFSLRRRYNSVNIVPLP